MELVNRPPFDENGYPEGFTEQKKKKKRIWPWVLCGAVLVLALGIFLFIRFRLTPAERGANAILTACREVFGSDSLFLRKTGLSEDIGEVTEGTYESTFSFSFKSTDYEIPKSVPLISGFDLNLLSGAGIKVTREHGNAAELYGINVSYGAVGVKLLDAYVSDSEVVLASPNFLKSTFAFERNTSKEDWESWNLWELVPEKFETLVKEGVRAVLSQGERISERTERAKTLITHFWSIDSDYLLELLEGFSYEKVGKTDEHMTVHGKKQSVNEYRVEADSEAFGKFFSYLFDWNETLFTVTGTDGSDVIPMTLYLTSKDELAGLRTEFTVTAAGVRIPVEISAALTGEEKTGDACEITISMEKPEELTEEVQKLLGLTVAELTESFDDKLPDDLSELLTEYGTLTVGDLLSKSTIMTEDEVTGLTEGLDSERLVLSVTKKAEEDDDDNLTGKWSFDLSTDRLNIGTFTWEYDCDDNGKLKTELAFSRNDSTYFTITGEGKLDLDKEEKSYELSLSKLTLYEGNEFVFKAGYKLEATDGEPEKPTGETERNVASLSVTDISELKEELTEGIGLVKSFLELVGFN